jgi:hypothetical protein
MHNHSIYDYRSYLKLYLNRRHYINFYSFNKFEIYYGGGFIAFIVDKKVEGMVAKITVTARQGNYYNEQLHSPDQVPARLLNDSPNIVLECRGSTYLGRGRTNYIVQSLDVELACTYMNLVMDSFGLFGYDTKPWTKQMFHADVRISAGSMHSGNPIQMFEGAFAAALNIGNSSRKNGNWGIYNKERYDQLCQMYSDITGLNVYSCDEYAKGLGRP